MIKRHRPELARGKSNAEILELRKDPDLSKEMTAQYAAENEARLRRAGVPVTPTSTYLMHFAGPGGGVRLLQADPNTPVESILDDNAIKANSFLRGKTAGWVIAWANKKMTNVQAPKPSVWDRGDPFLPFLRCRLWHRRSVRRAGLRVPLRPMCCRRMTLVGLPERQVPRRFPF